MPVNNLGAKKAPATKKTGTPGKTVVPKWNGAKLPKGAGKPVLNKK